MDTKSGVRVATVHVADALDGAGRWERIGRAVLGFCASEPTAAETVSLGLAHHYYGAEMGGEQLAAANARARRRALAAASRRGVVAVIRAQRLTGPAAWLALAVHAQAVSR